MTIKIIKLELRKRATVNLKATDVLTFVYVLCFSNSAKFLISLRSTTFIMTTEEEANADNPRIYPYSCKDFSSKFSPCFLMCAFWASFMENMTPKEIPTVSRDIMFERELRNTLSQLEIYRFYQLISVGSGARSNFQLAALLE